VDVLAVIGGSGLSAASGAEEFGSELGSGGTDVVVENGAPDPSTDGGGAVTAEPGSRKANVMADRCGFSREGLFRNGCCAPMLAEGWCGSLACCAQCAAGGGWAELGNHKANAVNMGIEGAFVARPHTQEDAKQTSTTSA